MFDVFSNEKFIKDLVEKNRTLAQKLKDVLQNFLKQLRNMMNSFKESAEMNVLREQTEALEEIRSSFHNALRAASEEMQNSLKNEQKNNAFRTDGTEKAGNGVIENAHKSIKLTDDEVEQSVTLEEDELSEKFVNETIASFGITKVSDYVHVQRQVINTLLRENFFTNKELRSRTDINKMSGMVIETNKSGIDETFSMHNYTKLGVSKRVLKLATIRMLPEIIQNGRLYADEAKNHHSKNSKVKFAYIEYLTEIDGNTVLIKIDIKKSPQKNKFWVHRVNIKKENTDFPAVTNKVIKQGKPTGSLTENVTQSSSKVNTQNQKSIKIPNTEFSLSDSEGRELSTEQREYFKDSKIKDANGNLKVMHHGSHESFTVFDKKKARSSGTYGNGFYFTDSKSHAGTYGDSYDVYLNITNPLQDGTNDITKDQLRKFVEAIAEEEDYGIENYGYGATIDSVTDSVYGKSDFGMLMDLNISCVGNMVEAVELFNKVNGTETYI